MTNLWRGAAAVAILCGAVAACESPHYPISRDQTPGPAPLSAPRPQFPISADAASAATPTPRAAEAPPSADTESAPLAAPVAHVESQPLAPISYTAPRAHSALFASHAAAAEAPGDGANAPVATSPAAASPAASPAANPAPAPAADSGAVTPHQVVHDQPAPAPSAVVRSEPVRDTGAEAPRRATEREAREEIAGQVVDAHDEIFQNYEVQKGDHIDQLARAFNTTRSVLLGANHVRPPYLLHPGQILKVPAPKAYVAEAGDTLSGVARRFSVEVGELAQINHISERASLRSGQRIGLPSSMRDRGPLRVGGASEYAAAEPRRREYREYELAPAHPGLTPLVPSAGEVVPSRSASYAPPPAAPPPQSAPQLSDSDISAAAHGRFVWPVRGDILAKFGPTGVGRRNDGVDIKAAQGSEVKAAAPGEVVYAGDQVPGYGNLVLIKHADGWVTAYAHLDSVDVRMKDQVAQGQVLGLVGTTGGVSQPELHFEVRYAPTPADKARPVDPVLVLPAG